MTRILSIVLMAVVTGWAGAVVPLSATPDDSTVAERQLPLAYIETTRDGIAQVLVADLLRAVPSLRMLSSDGLHLMRRGWQVSFALLDRDGQLSDDDTLLFVGSHAAGDTTYFDAYSTSAAYEVWYDPSLQQRRLVLDTTKAVGGPLRQHLFVQRHIEQEREYVQGWLDDDRYRQTQSTFVTETVPGEGWVWAITNPLRPFATILPVTPDPERDDSILVSVVYSAISDDVYTNPDHRLQCRYGGVSRDSATYDGPRYDTLRFMLRPKRDGCIVDSLVVQNTAVTIAAEAVDYIATSGYERAAAVEDYLVGACRSADTEQLELVNFRSSHVLLFDTLQGIWSTRTGERGVLFRLSARRNPQRIGIAIGDTAIITTRRPIIIAWLDQQQTVQVFSDNASAVAGLVGALPVGTPFAILIADGQVVEQSLREQLSREGSSSSASITAGSAYVGCGVRGEPSLYRERLGIESSSLVAWVATARGNAFRAMVQLQPGDHALVASGAERIEQARVRPCGGAHLLADTNRADYLVITHRSFRPSAERLAEYRSRRAGVRARVVDVQDIFDAFGRGEKSPHAIKAFLRYTYHHWRAPAPRAVLLVGDASWDPRKVSKGASNDDYIPSYGKPVSDFWYTLLDGDDYVPEMSIGRLPVTTATQAEAIVNKIIEHDTLQPARWHKRFLFITGGSDAAEQVDFYESVIYSLLPLLVDPYQRALCADTVLASFYAGTSSGAPVPSAIVGTINSGAVWVNYIGHGAPRSLEVAGWEPERLRNSGRYPVLASFSCQIGAFAEPTIQALGEDFLSAPSAGMVAVIATTGFGIRSYDDIVNAGIFATVARTTHRTLGDVLNRAKFYLFDGTQLAINTIMQTTLLGDPLTRLPIDTIPHPVFDAASLTVQSIPESPTPTINADSIAIEVAVFNAGVYADTTITVQLIHTYQSRSDTLSSTIAALCYPERLRFVLPVRNMPGEHILRFEFSTQNRQVGQPLQVPLYVYADQLYAVEPQPGWNISPLDTVVRFLNPVAGQSPFEYEAVLISGEGDTLASSTAYPVRIYPTHCEWRFPRVLAAGNEYQIRIRGYNQTRQSWSPPLTIPVVVTEHAELNAIVHAQGRPANWSRSTTLNLTPTEDGSLAFATSLPVELLSAGGYQPSQNDSLRSLIQPAYRLRLGGTNVASERNDEIGVHLAVLSAHTGELKAVRWYATWTTARIGRSDGGVQELITFLRDTVSAHDYVLMVSCGGAWTLQFSQYAESFRSVLREFGAHAADSLQQSRSYLFVGMRSSNRPFLLERIGDDRATSGSDTIAATFALPLFPLVGQLDLPIAGPAERWKRATLDVQQTRTHVRLDVWGSQSSTEQMQLLATVDTPQLRLDSIDAARYPYLRCTYTLSRDSGDFSPCTLSAAAVEYVPRPEFAVTLDVSDLSPLRGDTVSATAQAINLVSRCGVRQVSGIFQLLGPGEVPVGGSPVPDDFRVSVGDTTLHLKIPTLDIPDETTIRFSIAPQQELYQFNNSASVPLLVRADNVPPTVRLYANGINASDTTIVPQKVVLDCAVLDSARIAISDSTALILRLNGMRLPNGALQYRFYPTDALPQHDRWNQESLARAAVSATVELERGVNILMVSARDATGNTTTAEYILLVPSSLNIDSVVVFPNPASAGQVLNASVVYHGFEPNASAHIEIYDVLGKRVFAMPIVLYSGSNQLNIPLIEQQSGRPLQSGAYYWRLWLESSGAVDAKSGVFMVLQ